MNILRALFLFSAFSLSSVAADRATHVADVTVPLTMVDGKAVIDETAFTSSEPLARLIGKYCTALLNRDRKLWAGLFSDKKDLTGSDFNATPPSPEDVAASFEFEKAWLDGQLRGGRVRAILITPPLWLKGLTFRTCVPFRLIVEYDRESKPVQIQWELPSVLRSKDRLSVPLPKKNLDQPR